MSKSQTYRKRVQQGERPSQDYKGQRMSDKAKVYLDIEYSLIRKVEAWCYVLRKVDSSLEDVEGLVRIAKRQKEEIETQQATINTLFDALVLAKPHLWKASIPSNEWVIICGAITIGLTK